jgi:hypothetical protein
MNLTRNVYFQFLAFYVFVVFMNYFMPGIVRILFFTSLLFFFFRSRDNAFWIALFFLIQYAPAYLFNPIDTLYNLNFYKIPGSDRNVSFTELTIVIIFFKALKNRINFKVNRVFLMLIFFSIFLFFLSFAFGISGTKILRTIRFIIPFSLFWSLPALLLTKERFLEIFNYFLIFSVIIFLLQLYMFATGRHFFMLLGGQFQQRFSDLNDIVYNAEDDLLRPLYSTHILFLNIITGLYYFLTNSSQKPKFLSVYLTLSFIGLVITGTRGYSIGAIIMILLFVLLSPHKIKTISKYLVFAVVGLSILLIIPSVNSQMSKAIDRLMTVKLLAEGDITAGGTAQRFDKYTPAVMKIVKDSPLIGFGFSNVFYSYTNAHVAMPNILLSSGILGLLIFLIFIFYFYYRSLYLFKHLHQVYIIISIGLTGFLIIHIFSFAVFSFLLGQANYACFVLFMCFSDAMFRDIKRNQYHLIYNRFNGKSLIEESVI